MEYEGDYEYLSDINFIKKEIIDIDYIGDRLEELIKSEQQTTQDVDVVLEMHENIEKLITEMNLEQVLKSTKQV